MTDRLDRATGALLGLAAGDAASFPAMYHRQTAVPNRRVWMWRRALDADAQLVNKFPLPYSQSAPLEVMAFGATDDAEQAALAADVLLAAGGEPTADDLFDAWWRIVEPQADTLWGSIADRIAIDNARRGLRVPDTGNDNPHHFDDSSIARAVPVGIRWAGDAPSAARVARRLASITNADVGIDGAAAFAVAIAILVDGGTIGEATGAARREIADDSWTGRKWDLAEQVLADAGSAFAAVPQWHDEVSNREYSYGNVVAETLPLAFMVARESRSLAEGLGLAALLPKAADTLPAMVGALLGAAGGTVAIDARWTSAVGELRGICVPSTRGTRLADVATRLLAVTPAATASTGA